MTKPHYENTGITHVVCKCPACLAEQQKRAEWFDKAQELAWKYARLRELAKDLVMETCEPERFEKTAALKTWLEKDNG